VENIAFNTPWDSDPVPPPTLVERWNYLIQPALKYGAFLVLFVLAYLLLVRPVSKAVLKPLTEQPVVALAGAAPASLEASKMSKALEAHLGETIGGSFDGAQNLRKADVLKQRVAELVRRDPEASAQLVRAWLTEKGK